MRWWMIGFSLEEGNDVLARGEKWHLLKLEEKFVFFWHSAEYITESTIPTGLAHLRLSNRPQIQSDLEFLVPVETKLIRNVPFYEV